MHNLGAVISFEFLRTIKKKTFWLSVLAFPLLMATVIGLSYFSGQSADKLEEQASHEKFSMLVRDDSRLLQRPMLAAAGARIVDDKQAGIEAVRSDKVDAFIYYPADPTSKPIEVYAQDAGLMKNSKYTTVAEQLLRSSVIADIGSAQKVAIVQGGVRSQLTTYIDGKVADITKRMIAPGALLVLLYLIIILLGNQMLASTTEEKENRVIEMILTAVAARTLIIGKIIALILLGAVQIAVIVLPVLIAATFFSDQLNIPSLNLAQLEFDPIQMLVGVLLFIFSFMLFTGLLVAIGAAVPTTKEANNFFGVAIFGMFIPLYAALAIIADPDQLIVRFFSFFPLTAPVTLLLRNAVGNLHGLEALLGILVLAVSSIVALAVATRAFSQGTLEYDRKLSFRELFLR